MVLLSSIDDEIGLLLLPVRVWCLPFWKCANVFAFILYSSGANNIQYSILLHLSTYTYVFHSHWRLQR